MPPATSALLLALLALESTQARQAKQDNNLELSKCSVPQAVPGTSLLQRGTGSAQRVTDPRLIAWLHIPKCGTSFGTSLFHYANASLPEDAQIPTAGTVSGDLVPMFLKQYPVATWFRDRFWEKNGNLGEHAEITSDIWNRFKGHFYGMFRKPAARAYSSWKFFRIWGCKDNDIDAARYSRRVAGLATKMVAGQAFGVHCTLCPQPCENVIPDVALASSRLEDGFRFVGLTEEWSLSVCLFHAMVGGECLPSEFVNVNPGQYNSTESDEKRYFDSAHDPYDEALYAKAASIFWANVAKYKVTRRSCMATCSRVSHIFADDLAMLSYVED